MNTDNIEWNESEEEAFALIDTTKQQSLSLRESQAHETMERVADEDGWISVNDKKPTEYVEVLIFSDFLKEIEVGRYVDDEFQYFGWGGHGCGDEWQAREDVTHWMPLPNSPTS